MRKQILTLHTISHAFTDMACAALIGRIASAYLTDGLVFAVIVLYDFAAFCLQLPFGMLLDKRPDLKRKYFAGSGMHLIAIAMIVFAAGGDLFLHKTVIASVLAAAAGVGNALFHIGTGVDTLEHSGWPVKAAPVGIFVSSGALGLYLGSRASGSGMLFLWLMTGTMALFGILEHLHRESPPAKREWKTGRLSSVLSRNASAIALLLLCVIVYRSFLGFVMKYTWKVDFVTGLIAVCGIVLGKAAGGILSDRFGLRKTMTVCLAICAGTAVFSEHSAAAGVMTLFLFNTTMSVAMVGLARVFPKNPGLAFGLNTAALFIGFAIHLLTGGQAASWLLAILILVSLFVLYRALAPLEDQTC